MVAAGGRAAILKMKTEMTKRTLSLSLKALVSAALLWVVINKAGVQNVMQNMRAMDPLLFLLSSLIYVCLAYIVSLRWRLLLDKKYPARKLFSFHMIGSFFNNMLPGPIGGDAVKVYYLYRETGQGGLSFGSVFLDRYASLFARLTIGLISGFFASGELETLRMRTAIPLFFATFLVLSLLLFGLRIGRSFSAVSDFYDYARTTLKKKRVMLQVLGLSVVIQILLIAMIAVISAGMGQRLSFTALFVLVPIIITVMAIPLSISGLGVREGAFVVLLGLAGVPAGVSASISFLWFLSMAAASLIGLVEYVRYRKRAKDAGRP